MARIIERKLVSDQNDPILLWLSHYPPEDRQRLLGQIQRGHYEGAAFELLLHELLLRQEFAVTVTLGTPDFKVVNTEGVAFDIEATSSTMNRAEAKQDAAAMDLRGCLDGSEYEGLILHIVMERFEGPVPGVQIRRYIESLVEKGTSGLFDNGRWKVEINLEPCEPGMERYDFGWGLSGVTPAPYLRRVIEKKAGKHKPGESPYIIAVNIEDYWWGDRPYYDEMVLSAFIMGRRRIRIPIDRHTGYPLSDAEATSGFSFDAAVTRGGREPIYQRVSGLWAFSSSYPLNHPLRSGESLRFPRYACYYPNPWADHPLENPFRRMRRCSVREGEYPVWPDGSESIADVLGLPPGWPQARNQE